MAFSTNCGPGRNHEMPRLGFQIDGVAPVPMAVSPHLYFKLRISDRAGQETPIQSVALRCQIRIEPTRRRYAASEQGRLFELFGQPSDWGRSVHSMLWTHVTLNVPGFHGQTEVDMPVACTFDFNVAATKYFAALEEGDVPLSFLFSGTVFYHSEGALRISQISWEEEADFRLPAGIWREMMEMYYPNTVWAAVPKDLYQQIDEYKRRHRLLGWEEALAKLLEGEVLGLRTRTLC